MENVYLFLLGKELIPETTDWARDGLSLAAGFGGRRLCPLCAHCFCHEQKFGRQARVPFTEPGCFNAICATPITENILVERNIT